VTQFVQHLVDALSLGGLYAMLGLGIALIFGIMRLVNFAHGELVMVGAFAAVVVGDAPWAAKLAAVVLVPVGFAVAMERIAFRPVRGAAETTLLVTSFALSYLLQNVALLLFGATPRGIDLSASLGRSLSVGALVIPRVSVAAIAATLVLLAALSFLLLRTSLGVQMRAAAEDYTMARVLGVRTDRLIACAFALSGLLAGASTYLIVVQNGSVYPTMGLSALLVAFIATVLGGLGSLTGAVVGGLVLGLMTVALDAYLPVDLRPYRDAFAYTAVIGLLLWKPQGLIVPRTARTRV
jgi:branched-chain amino acid transport system permease protein